jgi:hypothetical protein
MLRNGPDILALAADMPEPATSEDTTVEAVEPEVESEEVGSEPEAAPAPEPTPAPVPSTKLGWAASLKALEDAGQGELAAHAKRIQADATRKAQEAAQARQEAAAMLAEIRALKASLSAPAQPAEDAEAIDPWDANALRAMAQREARALLEAELAPMRAARDAEVKAQTIARKEAELDNWIDAHPDFANDESMQAEVAELIQQTQDKGRFIHLDDAYTVITSRRVAADAARLQAEAKARNAAKAKAVSKTQAGAKGTGIASAPRKPVSALSAAEIMALARQG